MSRTLNGLGFALTTALVLVGCTITTGTKDGSDGGASSDPSSSSSSSSSSGSSGTPTTGGPLSFSPANVPSDAPLNASGDWTFNTDTCGSTKVTIDTAKGTVSCPGQAPGSFTFSSVNQTDTSQGTLTAGLFVTNKLVIEPSMVVDVVGNRPLIIVALTSATIQGTLRASAAARTANGGGFDGAMSTARGGGPGGGQSVLATTGGGGGGHCGAGGGTAGAAGKPFGNAANVPLVGGSGGGAGTWGVSGGGGGAIQVIAGSSIEISGTGSVEVSGAGATWEGNGGGAGGAILMEAPQVSVFGALAANGGGGSEGDSDNNGADGTGTADAAKGGPASVTGYGSGGDGAANTSIDGQAGTQPDPKRQQGGGGGAAGWIRLNSKSGSATIGATAVISPSLTTTCATQGVTTTH